MIWIPILSVILGALLLPSSYYVTGQGLVITPKYEQPMVVPGPDIVATVLELRFPPGDQGIPAHYHSGPLVGYVIEGQFLFQMKDEPVRVIEAGSAFHENDRAIHVWGANASNSTECVVIVTLYGRPGEPTLTFVENFQRESYEQALSHVKKN